MKMLRMALAPALLAAFMSCNEMLEESSEKSRLSIKLTDAPFDMDVLESVDIEVFKIEMRQDGEMKVLKEQRESYDILQLRGGLTESLIEASVSPGRIDMLRIYIDSAKITMKDGRIFDMKIPSAESSGLKLFIEPAIEVGSEKLSHSLVLDFDISKSFVPMSGGSNKIESFNFKPVIRVANESVHGAVIGQVMSDMCSVADDMDDVPLDLALVQAYRDGEVVASGATDPEGNFALIGLEPGTYEVVVEASNHARFAFQSEVFLASESYSGFHTLAGDCASLNGRILSDNGTDGLSEDDYALDGAMIELYDGEGVLMDRTVSAMDGSFLFVPMFKGNYQLFVYEESHSSSSVDLEGLSSEPLEVLLRRE